MNYKRPKKWFERQTATECSGTTCVDTIIQQVVWSWFTNRGKLESIESNTGVVPSPVVVESCTVSSTPLPLEREVSNCIELFRVVFPLWLALLVVLGGAECTRTASLSRRLSIFATAWRSFAASRFILSSSAFIIVSTPSSGNSRSCAIIIQHRGSSKPRYHSIFWRMRSFSSSVIGLFSQWNGPNYEKSRKWDHETAEI